MADAVPIRRPSSILDEMREMQDRVMRRAYEIFERHGADRRGNAKKDQTRSRRLKIQVRQENREEPQEAQKAQNILCLLWFLPFPSGRDDGLHTSRLSRNSCDLDLKRQDRRWHFGWDA